jgi:hypothetical protein
MAIYTILEEHVSGLLHPLVRNSFPDGPPFSHLLDDTPGKTDRV